MNVKKLSDAAKVTTINEICEGIRQFIKENPESVNTLLVQLIEGTLSPLSEDDFFGTEGWAHCFGIE